MAHLDSHLDPSIHLLEQLQTKNANPTQPNPTSNIPTESMASIRCEALQWGQKSQRAKVVILSFGCVQAYSDCRRRAAMAYLSVELDISISTSTSTLKYAMAAGRWLK